MAKKTFQRERRFLCGKTRAAANYQEIEIYQMSDSEESRTLDKELSSPADLRRSSEAQRRQNDKNARRHFRQLVNTNFGPEDTHTVATYAPELRPASAEEAWKDFRNFWRHIKTRCRQAGLIPPECLAVMEWQEADEESGRKPVAPHFHILLKCGLSRDEIESCWHRKGKRLGRINSDRLQLDRSSLEALANYMMKYPNRKHRYFRSRGIRNPITPPPADGKWTRRQVHRICTDGRLYDPAFWAKKYPGWELNESCASYNDYTGWHISLKMRRRRQRQDGS